MFSISWQYLTGSSVATHVTEREDPEWPPHPDRVYQALVASWGERGQAADERAALEWLESLPEPEVAAPLDDEAPPAASRIVYVPTNDKASDPLARTRKERRFPSVLVGDATCSLTWPSADAGTHGAALARLAAGVPRLGHSSSLVRMWLDGAPPPSTWVPAGARDAPEVHLRVPEAGRLTGLVHDYADGGARWRRPRHAAWHPYVRRTPPDCAFGHHAGPMVVLRRVGGARLSPLETLGLAAALRALMNRNAVNERSRVLLSGHAPDGIPLEVPHAAYVPLPFVDALHADGHVLGAAIVLPRESTYEDEQAVWAALAAGIDPVTDTLTIASGEGREVSFVVEERPAPPAALRASSWSRASTVWGTVTPLVLGRQPPRRHHDADGFVRGEVIRSCIEVGLPPPAEVRLLAAAALSGVPHAGEFPPLPHKQGLRRRQLHVWLRFEQPVGGPVLLGAGRYRGYGLCRPIFEGGAR